MKKSFSNRLANKVFKLLNVKNFYENEMYLKKQAEHLKKEVKAPLTQKNLWQKRLLNGFSYFETKNKNFSKIIVYFHGGAFISQPNIFHWNFLKKLHKETNAKIFLPIYPKAPKHTHKEAYAFLFEFLKVLQEKSQNKTLIFMGDSAGGNIALSLSLQTKNITITKNILFSPCLDLTLSSPEIKEIESQDLDIFLSKEGLLKNYKKWAGSTDLKSPILSPINANLQFLPNTIIFVGTNEILYPETVKFYSIAKKQNKNISLIVGEEQSHAYPLHPFKEFKPVVKQIIRLIKD